MLTFALQFLLMQCLSTLALQRKHAKALFMLVLVLPMNQANCLNQLHNKKTALKSQRSKSYKSLTFLLHS